MSTAFKDWVTRHQIGPGMNDNYNLAYINAKRVSQGLPIHEPVTYYTGRDGEVGDGWVPVLDQLATDLKALGWTGGLDQVKEKFGYLRFYYRRDGIPEDKLEMAQTLVDEATFTCSKRCEDCGSTSDVTTDASAGRYWIRTMCAACRNLAQR